MREKKNKKGFLSCSSLPAGCASLNGDTHIQQDIKSIVYFSILLFFALLCSLLNIQNIHDIQCEFLSFFCAPAAVVHAN